MRWRATRIWGRQKEGIGSKQATRERRVRGGEHTMP